MSDWFDQGGTSAPLDVPALFDSEAAPLLLDVVALGALVSLGLTSDGGALGITVTVDGRWRREYFRESEPLASWLLAALPSVEQAVKARAASSGPRSRQRGRRDA